MTILTILQQILGNYIRQKDEYLFHCPFCHHHKKKLSINIANNKWKCWTCNSYGGHIIWLLKKLNLPQETLKQVKEVLGETDFKQYRETESVTKLHLPLEYKPLWKPVKTYQYLHAISYLKQRGILSEDVLRYRMGYCESGPYKDRIIVPSYDVDQRLNYFTARSYYEGSMKYKNPPISKNVVCFENMVDWTEPVILCEGMFDAIALRRNAIPLLGKTISRAVMKALLQYKTKDVIIFLDHDALEDALRLEYKIKQYGINTKLVLTDQKDASDMGFETAWQSIDTAESTDFKTLITQRLSNI